MNSSNTFSEKLKLALPVQDTNIFLTIWGMVMLMPMSPGRVGGSKCHVAC